MRCRSAVLVTLMLFKTYDEATKQTLFLPSRMLHSNSIIRITLGGMKVEDEKKSSSLEHEHFVTVMFTTDESLKPNDFLWQ